MKALAIKNIEECLDGTVIKEISFDRALDLTDYEKLSKLGESKLYNFERPFFKIISGGGYMIKGVIGECDIRLIITGADKEKFITEINDCVGVTGNRQ